MRIPAAFATDDQSSPRARRFNVLQCSSSQHSCRKEFLARTPTEPEGWNKMMKKPQRKKSQGIESNLGREQGDL